MTRIVRLHEGSCPAKADGVLSYRKHLVRELAAKPATRVELRHHDWEIQPSPALPAQAYFSGAHPTPAVTAGDGPDNGRAQQDPGLSGLPVD
jgi:hypothetical protein